MTDFNTEPIEEVLQETTDEGYDSALAPVRVCIREPVQVDEMPTILGPCKNFIIPAAGDPQRILDRNPRRKSAQISIQNGDVCAGGTIGEARGYVGAILSGGLAVPYKFGFSSELWARGVFVDVTGTAIALGDSTDAVLVSVIEEFWTR